MREFKYTFRNEPVDYFKYFMSNIYYSMMAVVNIVFTCALAALIFAKWNDTNWLGKTLMVIGVTLFPVIQPLVIYIRGIKTAKSVKEETTLVFDDDGMHITVKEHHQLIRWKDFVCVMKRFGLIMVIPDGKHAYLLSKKVVGDSDELFDYITDKINRFSSHKEENDRANKRK